MKLSPALHLFLFKKPFHAEILHNREENSTSLSNLIQLFQQNISDTHCIEEITHDSVLCCDLPEKLPWMAWEMPVARWRVRLYRNMAAVTGPEAQDKELNQHLQANPKEIVEVNKEMKGENSKMAVVTRQKSIHSPKHTVTLRLALHNCKYVPVMVFCLLQLCWCVRIKYYGITSTQSLR